MTLSVQLNKEDEILFKKHAQLQGLSLSEMVRRAVLEKIEDEYDQECCREALEEIKKDPRMYSLSEMKKELGL